MYDVADTIVAISSAGGGVRSIVRITGPQTIPVCERLFRPRSAAGADDLESEISNPKSQIQAPRLLGGSLRVTDALAVDARLYLFFAPRSYTGEMLAEIHLDAGRAIVEALVQNLLSAGLRPAGPGEFTARAYLNGKLDLAQAEAVNEIVSSSNRLQLDAAQRLLGGRLTRAAEDIRSDLLDVLSLIEAGLDFSGEDIEFIGKEQAIEQLAAIQTSLDRLLAGSIRCETLIELPAVGIAGAPNAGKSSLLNALLGSPRSIVSHQRRTTRDVLTGVLATARLQCVLFDCAGLLPTASPEGSASRIDELAQQAAVEALQNCHAVLFCVDSAKSDWGEDLAVRAVIQPRRVIHLATKSDLLSGDDLSCRLRVLAEAFRVDFLPVSAATRHGLPDLLAAVERCIADVDVPATPSSADFAPDAPPLLTMTARHRQAIVEAMDGVRRAGEELARGSDEIAVTMLRAACQSISQIEQEHIDEQVLDRIFSRFCIGK